MEKLEVSNRVKKVIKSVLNLEDEIDDNANFIFDLGAGSMQSVQLIAGFEEEFEIEMDEEGAMRVQTVAEAVEFIIPYLTVREV